jgi:tagatose 6-phosphate kinase
VILAVCLNFALDLTYTVDELRPHTTNRVTDVRSRAGGKGINVARVLDALGHEVVVTGFAGGRVGDAARAELRSAGLADALVPAAGETRRTLIVLEDAGGEPTGISEPGPHISPHEWDAFVTAFRDLAAGASAVALSGSLPPGVPAGAYATLARESAAPVLLDTSGEALREGVRGAPAIVKPNRLELADLAHDDDVVAAAQRVRESGPEAVVVSAGAEGLVAITPDGVLRAAPPEAVEGNPIGAGDAAAAALVAGMVAGTPWPERLADAVALSAAAVHAPVAGSFDAEAYARYRRTVVAA